MKKNFLKVLVATLFITSSMTVVSNAEIKDSNSTSKGSSIISEYKKGDASTYIELGDITSKNEEKNKEEIAELYYSFKEGKISKNDYLEKANELNNTESAKEVIERAVTFKEQEKLRGVEVLTTEQQEKINNTGGYNISNSVSTRAASNMIWDLYQSPQQKNYYCGPSTAKSILGAKGYNIDQSTLGEYKWLETEYWGNTPWWVGSATNGYSPMEYTLDKYQGTQYYSVYASDGSIHGVKSKVIISIDNDYGIAGNTWEVAGGKYLPGHPQGYEVLHWIAIDGYYNSGDTIHYAEPVYNASSISWYKNVTNPYYNVDVSTMAYVLSGRGLVW